MAASPSMRFCVSSMFWLMGWRFGSMSASFRLLISGPVVVLFQPNFILCFGSGFINPAPSSAACPVFPASSAPPFLRHFPAASARIHQYDKSFSKSSTGLAVLLLVKSEFNEYDDGIRYFRMNCCVPMIKFMNCHKNHFDLACGDGQLVMPRSHEGKSPARSQFRRRIVFLLLAAWLVKRASVLAAGPGTTDRKSGVEGKRVNL